MPKRLEPVAFGLLLSGLMSLLVSGVSTALAAGLGPGFPGAWVRAWLPSWAIAFPAVLIVAPLVRRTLARIVVADAGAGGTADATEGVVRPADASVDPSTAGNPGP